MSELVTPSTTPPPELPPEVAWPERTRDWWKQLTTDPPKDIDWEYATETALVHADVWAGNLDRLPELRKRLDKLRPPGRNHPWTTEDSRILTSLHAEGKTLGQIADLMGRSKGTVSLHARKLELDWDRAQTAVATEAHITDAKAARAEAALAELQLLRIMQEDVLDVQRGRKGWKTILRGAMGVEESTVLGFVPVRDADMAARARSSSSQTIDRLTANLSGVDEQAVSLIDGIAAQLGLDDNKEVGDDGGEPETVGQAGRVDP
ncbi:hypothetical protein GCM10009785_01470 [Brooklawnia cerclae]|uniref:Helix-turn-helix domain-containing protein n=1 Tax=Brooklawnia cerclae TaxID=349934 RepID=A0ABX0SD39_9ACTN|nr:winged helix-turn-helix domain-containing protein [Brooklawnia cerclae]NIH56259.1 hypothetical protein [Brooklawnia cerclae]